MDAHKSGTGQIIKTKEILYIKVIGSTSYLYSNGKLLNFYLNSSSKVIVTTQTSQERPDLNIYPLEIKIT